MTLTDKLACFVVALVLVFNAIPLSDKMVSFSCSWWKRRIAEDIKRFKGGQS